MKTKLPLTVISALLVNSITCTGLFAQGALVPAGPPAPTMKSLQEIWDRIGELEAEHASNLASLETEIGELQEKVSSQESRNASNLALLLSSLGGVLPFQLSTVDSTGSVGARTSLAFSPGGAPAISYYDITNHDLKVAVYNGASWDLSTVDSTGAVGRDTSLAFSPGGEPAISYYDGTNQDLKFAIQQSFQVGP